MLKAVRRAEAVWSGRGVGGEGRMMSWEVVRRGVWDGGGGGGGYGDWYLVVALVVFFPGGPNDDSGGC